MSFPPISFNNETINNDNIYNELDQDLRERAAAVNSTTPKVDEDSSP